MKEIPNFSGVSDKPFAGVRLPVQFVGDELQRLALLAAPAAELHQLRDERFLVDVAAQGLAERGQRVGRALGALVDLRGHGVVPGVVRLDLGGAGDRGAGLLVPLHIGQHQRQLPECPGIVRVLGEDVAQRAVGVGVRVAGVELRAELE